MRSRPEAILPATVRVGEVSPRSTCESIGAETPERSASSRSERCIERRSALTRSPNGPILGRYRIHDGRMLSHTTVRDVEGSDVES